MDSWFHNVKPQAFYQAMPSVMRFPVLEVLSSEFHNWAPMGSLLGSKHLKPQAEQQPGLNPYPER